LGKQIHSSLNIVHLSSVDRDVAARTGMTIKDVHVVTKALFKSILSFMEQGKIVNIRDFAKFYCATAKARLIRIPNDEKFFMPDHWKPRVIFKRKVKSRIRRGSIQNAKKKQMDNRSTAIDWDDQQLRPNRS